MPRPQCRRVVAVTPAAALFKPAGIPASELEAIALSLDELEAVRLADLEGLYQEDAARRMGVSRPTFGRIVEAGRRKIAEAICLGRALRIEGGAVAFARGARCPRCTRRRAALPNGQCRSCDPIVTLRRRPPSAARPPPEEP